MLSPAKEAQLFGVKDRCFQTWGGKAKRLIFGRADGAFFIRECNIGDAGSHFSEAGKKADWKVCPCSVRTHGQGSREKPELLVGRFTGLGTHLTSLLLGFITASVLFSASQASRKAEASSVGTATT